MALLSFGLMALFRLKVAHVIAQYPISPCASRASVSQEGGIKNPRAKALWDKWRHVWMMAWERDRRLRDKLNYLQV